MKPAFEIETCINCDMFEKCRSLLDEGKVCRCINFDNLKNYVVNLRFYMGG